MKDGLINIRRATIHDAEGIHLAHMKSIQEICSKDHSLIEIQAWGNRPFQEEHRVNAIKNDYVWVVEDENLIQGYGHLRIYERNNIKFGHILGLYLTPEVQGKYFGKKIFDMMMEVIVTEKAKQISLESTITAKEFYKSRGFLSSGPEITITINGSPVRCYPMKKVL